MNGDSWQSIKHTEETRKNAINYVCYSPLLELFLKQYMSETASYGKRVARDCLFPDLGYDMIILKNAMNKELEKQQKVIKVNEVRHKLMKMIHRTAE